MYLNCLKHDSRDELQKIYTFEEISQLENKLDINLSNSVKEFYTTDKCIKFKQMLNIINIYSDELYPYNGEIIGWSAYLSSLETAEILSARIQDYNKNDLVFLFDYEGDPTIISFNDDDYEHIYSDLVKDELISENFNEYCLKIENIYKYILNHPRYKLEQKVLTHSLNYKILKDMIISNELSLDFYPMASHPDSTSNTNKDLLKFILNIYHNNKDDENNEILEEILNLLVKKGAVINNILPLYIVGDKLRFLINVLKVDINSQARSRTFLSYLIECQSPIEDIKFLLEKGAEINIGKIYGEPIIDYVKSQLTGEYKEYYKEIYELLKYLPRT